VTGARFSVESVAPGASGTLVTLATAMDGVTVLAGYDRDSGVVLTLEIVQTVTGGTIQLQLVNWRATPEDTGAPDRAVKWRAAQGSGAPRGRSRGPRGPG